MRRAPDYLYELLPVVYRTRDADQGFQLRALLRVINEQVNVLEDDIAQLYENWFIETCDDWVLPYIGDLVGYEPVQDAGRPGAPDSAAARLRNRMLVPRREVGNTIALRRRKGTLALLENLAGDVAGWPARALEFYTLLGWTQNLNHQRLARGRTADLRAGDVLARLDGPFDQIAHTVDVRRVMSHRARGRHNIASVGVFAWRLKQYSVSGTPACSVEAEGTQCYTFSILGNDTPLYTLPQRQEPPTQGAGEIHFPMPIPRRAFEQRLSAHPLRAQVSARYYGPGLSLSISVRDWPEHGMGGVIAPQALIPADLSDWHAYSAPRNKVLVDPVRGRFVFPAEQLPERVWVSYHYGFSADMGGGEYERPLSQPEGARRYRVRKHAGQGEFGSIGLAYAQWGIDKDVADALSGEKPHAALIEIMDSGAYQERFNFRLDPGESLQLRAANHARPVLRLLDYNADQADPFSVSGGAGSRFTLDGLLVTGRGIEIVGPSHLGDGEGEGEGEVDVEVDADVDRDDADKGEGSGCDGDGDGDEDGDDGDTAQAGDLCDVTIRHCTLVPGWGLRCDCGPQRPGKPSVTLRYSRARLRIESSILGPVWIIADERSSDPAAVSISDSIIDACGEEMPAMCDKRGRTAFVTLDILRSSVIGSVAVHALGLAENVIFMGPVLVARRQAGCLRFCYVTPPSRTPRRYHCEPDRARQTIADTMRAAAARSNTIADAAAIALAQAREAERVRPHFNSLRYGMPSYCQLHDACAVEITRGADDESEMGAFHDLFQAQRAASLRARLDEFTPAGMAAGILYAS